MFLPLSDTPNPPGRPLVTWLLMTLNIGVYLLLTVPAAAGKVNLADPLLHEYLQVLGLQGMVTAQEVYDNITAYDLLVFQFGFRPAEFSLVSLFSSLFLHGGLLHLAGNMLFLYIFGNNVEYRLGRLRYLLTYLGCGVVATLFFALFSPGSQVPLIGASGAISGVLGCYFLWFPRNRVRCFLFFFPFIMTSIYLSARLVLGIYLLLDNLLPFLFTAGSESGVAHGAHIGGFLGGLAVVWGSDRYYQWQSRVRRSAKQPGQFSSTFEQICPAVMAGDLAAASACYLQLDNRSQRAQVDSNDVMLIGNYLLEQGRHRDALRVFRRFVAERQNDQRIDQAYLGAGKAMLLQPRYLTSAYHYFLSALDLAHSEQLAGEARLQLRAIEEQRNLEKDS